MGAYGGLWGILSPIASPIASPIESPIVLVIFVRAKPKGHGIGYGTTTDAATPTTAN